MKTFDDFLLTTWEQEVENQQNKELENPGLHNQNFSFSSNSAEDFDIAAKLCDKFVLGKTST